MNRWETTVDGEMVACGASGSKEDARAAAMGAACHPKLVFSDPNSHGYTEVHDPETLPAEPALRLECLRIAAQQPGDPLLRARDLFDFVMTGKT